MTRWERFKDGAAEFATEVFFSFMVGLWGLQLLEGAGVLRVVRTFLGFHG